jgi:TonB-dependent starch-binding outer membrane protein SusC
MWQSHRAAAVLAVAMSLALAAPLAAQQRLAINRPAYIVKFSADAPVDVEALPVELRRTVTIKLTQVTIERALREVMAQGSLSLTYSRAVVPLDRVVSVDVDNQSVLDALRQVLGGANVELWMSRDGRMALVPAERVTTQAKVEQTGTITGVVRAAESGEGLPGAVVTVVGTRFGATTDNDGRYAIRGLTPGSVLLNARRIGYGLDSSRVTVVADQTTTADFSLHVLAVQLSEVVAVGYGTQSRRELTGAVSSISSDEIQRAPVQSVDQALLGRVPGVQVVTSSGQPGAGAMVRVRGGNSISAGNDPLYVIDGVPIVANANGANTYTLQSQGMSGLSPVAAISPDDIESVDILKDASATAIYGARAANGVILITTKRGHAGESAVTLNAYYGQQEVRHKLSLMNAPQFAQLVNTAYTNAGQAPVYSQSDIAAMGNGTDWQSAIFRSAPLSNVDLGFSGGDDKTKYYVSANLMRNQGVVIGTNMNRGAFRLNLDKDISDKFRIGNRLSFSREEGQILPNGGNGQETSSVILNAILAPPTLPVFTSSGEYFVDVNPLTGRPFSNPVATARLITNREQQNRVIGNGFAEYDLLHALTLRSSFGMDYLGSTQDYYSPSNTNPGRNFGGFGSRGSATTTTWLNENTVHYNRQAWRASTVDLLGGVTFQRTQAQNISGTSQGFLTDRLTVNGLNTGSTFVSVYTASPHSSLLSYFARANWDVADKYLFTATGRVDGSSKFGEGNQYGIFPSAAVAWRASNEQFIKNLGWFDDLKVRASYGRTGNQDIGNYQSLATLAPTTYVFGGQRAVGYVPNSLANPDLKWETTDQADVGVDVAILKSRVFLNADYYDKRTHDLLLYVHVPATSGFNSSLQNVGSVGNKGFELGINTVNLAGAFGWTSALNLAWNRNKVLNIGVDSQLVGVGGVGAGANQDPTILKVGQPINAFYGWVYSGIQNGEPQYKDLNGDGQITDDDRTIIGNAQPNYTGGLSNRFTYKNFALSVFLQWSVGNKIYNINRALLTSAAGNANQFADVLQKAGTDGSPTPKIGNTFDSHPSTLFVEDGTYLRGKNIRLDYTVPSRWLSAGRFGRLSSLGVYVSAQNFFTSTKYTGFDPEITEYAGSNLAQGFDFGTYPQPRQITFGLTTSF